MVNVNIRAVIYVKTNGEVCTLNKFWHNANIEIPDVISMVVVCMSVVSFVSMLQYNSIHG